jgi:hypothetical protein
VNNIPNYPQGSPVAPGTDTVVEAGNLYNFRDKDGKEFGIDARENPATVEFLSAFDTWIHVQGQHVEQRVKDELWHAVEVKFATLPISITDKLPSRRSGITVVGR